MHLCDTLKNEKVYIDTDSEKVISDCKKKYKKFTVYKREQKFIDLENKKNSNISPVLLMYKNFLQKYVKNQNEIIIASHVTSPFIKLSTFKKAVKYLNKFEFVHSVTKHKEFTWMEIKNKYKEINFDPKKVTKTQSLKPIIFSNGAFLFLKRKVL